MSELQERIFRLEDLLRVAEANESKVMAERDHAMNIADRLAGAISGLLDVEIGEHTSMNDPWQNALMYAQARITSMRKPAAELFEEMVAEAKRAQR